MPASESVHPEPTRAWWWAECRSWFATCPACRTTKAIHGAPPVRVWCRGCQTLYDVLPAAETRRCPICAIARLDAALDQTPPAERTADTPAPTPSESRAESALPAPAGEAPADLDASGGGRPSDSVADFRAATEAAVRGSER